MDFIVLLRQYKIGPFAIFDSVLAFAGVWLVAPLLSKLFALFKIEVPRLAWLWLTLPLSVGFHVLFGQATPLTAMVIDPNGGWLVKAVLLVMCGMGLRLIKRKKGK